MENTRTETRKLTLDEYVDVLQALKKSLWSIQFRIDEKKEIMQKNDPAVCGDHYADLYKMHKCTHDLLVSEAEKLTSTISIVEENSLSLWSDK